ncbi:ABC transporter ATP-binding protein [Devosia sp. A8/3-2]|nr:ABC transporter ATP-binding protein [Devosia sp. A8/3-2]
MSAPDQTILSVSKLSSAVCAKPVLAVRDVSFELGAERLGIVGESGSGKSTVGRAIMRLLPNSARVEAERLDFEGAPLLDLNEGRMRKLRGHKMALIMQDPRYSLNPVLSVGKQVAEAAKLHLGSGKREAYAAAAAMLERVRIADVERTMRLYPHQISGGMGQRVMIAMMLLAKPAVVIADEPTSALDVSVRGDVLKLLDELVTENNSGPVLISHDIRMVAAFCQRIPVMYKGHVVESLTRLEDASHPYTKGLIAAMPDPRHPAKRLQVLDRKAIDAAEARP